LSESLFRYNRLAILKTGFRFRLEKLRLWEITLKNLQGKAGLNGKSSGLVQLLVA
jgi:hypothetical protein